MKKIDNRDLPNMQTSQDIIRRYDLSALDQLSVKKGNNEALGVGMEPTIKAGVQSKDGFFDEDGDNILDSTLLQPIQLPQYTDLNDLTTPGMYYSPINSDVANMSNVPINYAFSLLVEKHAGAKQTLTDYHTGYAEIWVRNYYSGTWGDWVRLIVEDENGDIEVSRKIIFSNGDYIRYDDSDNHWWVSTDGGAERRLIDGSHIRAYTMLVTPVANTPTYAYLSYGHTFKENPMVVATAHTSVPGSTVKEVSSSSPSTTGTRIYIYRTSTTTTTIDVIVMERT